MRLIYLASQSARRRTMLRKMRLPFKVVPSLYQERSIRTTSAQGLALRHAKGKALKALVPRSARIVLAADTIVWRRGRVFGKPKSFQDAEQMLMHLSGQQHLVVTAIVLWDRELGRLISGYAKTKVWLRSLSRFEVKNYLQKISPLDKAGAYAIQARPKIVQKIEGSYSNVVGFPRELFRIMYRYIFKREKQHLKAQNIKIQKIPLRLTVKASCKG